MPSVLGKRKRAAAAASTKRDTRQAIIKAVEEQIDLERSLKVKELAATEARIAWAEALRSAIAASDGTSLPSSDYVRNAAISSYWSIGSAYYSWPRPKPLQRPRPSHTSSLESAQGHGSLSPPSAPPPMPEPIPHFPSASPDTLAAMQDSLAKGSKPLLVRYAVTPTAKPVLLLLACPTCQRMDLPTVHGFYNHCRLAHQVTYAGHSDGIEACGQLVSEEEMLSAGMQDVELKGLGVMSVKKMFQRAVGLDPLQPAPITSEPVIPSPSRVTIDTPLSPPATIKSEAVPSHLLNKTLGLHDETPALAHFLGKTARRRQIKVADVQGDIDILDDSRPARKNAPLGVRSRKGAEDAYGILLSNGHNGISSQRIEDLPRQRTPGLVPFGAAVDQRDQYSRFYISRRVIITDRSRYIPVSRRDATLGTDTHRWSLTVSAPSYMPPVSTSLKNVTVTLPADDLGTRTVLVLSEPPFTASGTCDAPFLAHVALSWAGDQNKDTHTDHWVELDLVRSGGWVQGDEQVMDVELDKDTVFLPNREELTAQRGFEDRSRSSADDAEKSSPESLMESLLKDLPLTMQDVRPGSQPNVPYSVIATRRKFAALPIGRRKSIEWQRARCLSLAVQSALADHHDEATSSGISTAEIFRWLSSRHAQPHTQPPLGHKLLPGRTARPSAPHPATQQFCAYCGAAATAGDAGPTCRYGCTARKPSVNLTPSLSVHQPGLAQTAPIYAINGARALQAAHRVSRYSSRDIISCAEPTLVTGIMGVLAPLNLSSLSHGAQSTPFPLDHLGSSAEEVDQFLSPFALLALVVKIFIRRLAARAVQQSYKLASELDPAAVPSTTKAERGVKLEGAGSRSTGHRRPNGYGRGRGRSALTPVHVLHALMAPSWDAPYAVGFDILTPHGLGTMRERATPWIKSENTQ